MTVPRLLSRCIAAAVFVSLFAALGCTTPKVFWSQRVELNGRGFVFKRINSLREGPEGHRIEYRDGTFIVQGKGPITVNGFEISAQDGTVTLANRRLDLQEGEEVHFSSDMESEVKPGN